MKNSCDSGGPLLLSLSSSSALSVLRCGSYIDTALRSNDVGALLAVALTLLAAGAAAVGVVVDGTDGATAETRDDATAAELRGLVASTRAALGADVDALAAAVVVALLDDVVLFAAVVVVDDSRRGDGGDVLTVGAAVAAGLRR